MEHKNISIAEALQLGLQNHQAGNLKQAEYIYRQVLRAEPAHPDALHLLGVIALQTGNSESAARLISRAIAQHRLDPEYHNNLGNALRNLRRRDEAMASYREALRLSPDFAEAHNNLGLAFLDISMLEEAAGCFRRALELEPECAPIHSNLGMVLKDLGEQGRAELAFREALRLDPCYAEAHAGLGALYKEMGRKADAMACFNEALRLKPDLAEAHSNIGAALRNEGRLKEAAACLREALRLKPDLPEAHVNLGAILQEQGQLEEAAENYRHALAVKPDLFAARWLLCMSRAKILYDSDEDVSNSRRLYRDELLELSRTLPLNTRNGIKSASEVVGGAQTFFLAYQGENDRDLQSLYGEMVCRIQSARYPQFAARPSAPSQAVGEPLRIGVVSGYFRYHSNWKIPIKGWVENLDRRKFALFGYHTGTVKDLETEVARRSFASFIQDLPSASDWAAAIRNDRLHVLIYPELGMDLMSLRLAALRLAPVQCTSWGHPDTSGLPTIDYYLSSDLMEPEGAQSHYSEKLVRLPNLSIYYTPVEVTEAPVDRTYFGLPDDAVLFFCAQSLFKYLPRHDHLLPRIASGAGRCQFVFLSYPKSEEVNERFRRRINAAFASSGLDGDRYVKLLPQQPPAHYKKLNMLCDVFLDSVGWSGCNSTLEAIESNMPIVTLPGSLMRGRHSLAILRMMGATQTVAATEDQYVAIACRLAHDPAWRRAVSAQMAAGKGRLYRDRASIAGLEDFLEIAAGRAG